MRKHDRNHWLNYALETAIKSNQEWIEKLQPIDGEPNAVIVKQRLADTFEQQIKKMQEVRAELNAPRRKRRILKPSKTTVL